MANDGGPPEVESVRCSRELRAHWQNALLELRADADCADARGNAAIRAHRCGTAIRSRAPICRPAASPIRPAIMARARAIA